MTFYGNRFRLVGTFLIFGEQCGSATLGVQSVQKDGCGIKPR